MEASMPTSGSDIRDRKKRQKIDETKLSPCEKAEKVVSVGSELPASDSHIPKIDLRDRKKGQKSAAPTLSTGERAVGVVCQLSAADSHTQKIDPNTPAKSVKRKRSALPQRKSHDLSVGQSSEIQPDVESDLTPFSKVTSAGTVYNMKVQVVVLWYKNLYSQLRPRSVTFVALDQEGALFEVVVSDILSEKWAPRLEEGMVYIFKRLLSSENEKKLNVIETQFQMNITRDTKCAKLNKKHLKPDIMLPLTKLNELSIVRPRENYLRHFVVYVIDVRPPSVRMQKNGEPSRFVEAYVVDETFTKTATVMTVWDNIFEQHEDMFGHGFTKPFVLTVFGLKVKDFRGRFTLSASNFTKFYGGSSHNEHAVKLQEWVTTKFQLKMLDCRDLLHENRLITLSEHADIKTIRQVKASTPDTLPTNEVLRFVVHGMITDIDIHHQIHYEACDQCNKSPGDQNGPSAACVSCGKSPVKVVPRFLLTMTIADSQDVMKVTAFDRDAQEILYTQVEKVLEMRAQKNGFDDLKRLANQSIRSSYSFYLMVSNQNLKFLHRSGFKIQMIDWIPRRCLSNSVNDPLGLVTSVVEGPSSLYTENDPSSGDSYVEIDSSSTSTATVSRSS